MTSSCYWVTGNVSVFAVLLDPFLLVLYTLFFVLFLEKQLLPGPGYVTPAGLSLGPLPPGVPNVAQPGQLWYFVISSGDEVREGGAYDSSEAHYGLLLGFISLLFLGPVSNFVLC